MAKREKGKTGRERWLESVEQMRAKSGPVYEKWLANIQRGIERAKVRKGVKPNA